MARSTQQADVVVVGTANEIHCQLVEQPQLMRMLPTTTLQYKSSSRWFASSSDDLPEPLCAIYEPSARAVLERHAARGHFCPRHIMIEEKAVMIALPKGATDALTNLNTPQDLEEVVGTDDATSFASIAFDDLIDGFQGLDGSVRLDTCRQQSFELADHRARLLAFAESIRIGKLTEILSANEGDRGPERHGR